METEKSDRIDIREPLELTRAYTGQEIFNALEVVARSWKTQEGAKAQKKLLREREGAHFFELRIAQSFPQSDMVVYHGQGLQDSEVEMDKEYSVIGIGNAEASEPFACMVYEHDVRGRMEYVKGELEKALEGLDK